MVNKKAVLIVAIITVMIAGIMIGYRMSISDSNKNEQPKASNVAKNEAKQNTISENEKKENTISENATSKEIENKTTEETENTTSQEKENTTSQEKENTTSKEKENTTSKEKENTTSQENENKDNKEKENTTSNSSSENKQKENSSNGSSSKTTTEKDPEKLAVSLAKEKWGNKNSNVYFDVEDVNEKKGIYTVVVRDSNTTIEMTTYKVDINKKTVTE